MDMGMTIEEIKKYLKEGEELGLQEAQEDLKKFSVEVSKFQNNQKHNLTGEDILAMHDDEYAGYALGNIYSKNN